MSQSVIILLMNVLKIFFSLLPLEIQQKFLLISA